LFSVGSFSTISLNRSALCNFSLNSGLFLEEGEEELTPRGSEAERLEEGKKLH
jgi:hypothetical protein